TARRDRSRSTTEPEVAGSRWGSGHLVVQEVLPAVSLVAGDGEDPQGRVRGVPARPQLLALGQAVGGCVGQQQAEVTALVESVHRVLVLDRVPVGGLRAARL